MYLGTLRLNAFRPSVNAINKHNLMEKVSKKYPKREATLAALANVLTMAKHFW